jgi:hypothetical protein
MATASVDWRSTTPIGSTSRIRSGTAWPSRICERRDAAR